MLERSVFVCELLPQDMKLETDELTREEAMKSARFLAFVVGKAHGKRMDAPEPRKAASGGELRSKRRQRRSNPRR